MQEDQIAQISLVPKPTLSKHYDRGARMAYIYGDFPVPFIQYED